MIGAQKYEDLLKKKEKLIFIDVRSPKEFEEAHIPNAVNIPVFDNLERELIGTLYKTEGKRTAIREALRIIGPKVFDIYLEFEKYYKKDYEMIVYCARGGMRSSTITALLKEFSMPLAKLAGGYKGYRQYLNDTLPSLIKEFQIITLYGKTGTGKTNILKKMKEIGYDILDLEGCANNRGSLLGGIGLGEKHSQKYFESLVFESLLNAKTKTILTEGESRRIGNIVMPVFLNESLVSSRKLYIEASLEKRIETIRKEYLKENLDSNEIIEAISKLKKYISHGQVDEYIAQINNNEFDFVISDLIEKYYDKVYSNKNKEYEKTFDNNDEERCVREIIEYLF